MSAVATQEIDAAEAEDRRDAARPRPVAPPAERPLGVKRVTAAECRPTQPRHGPRHGAWAAPTALVAGFAAFVAALAWPVANPLGLPYEPPYAVDQAVAAEAP